MKVSVGISNHHVHLSKADYQLLFGNEPLQKKVDLRQPLNFASTQNVTIKGEKGIIDNVRVLGPCRNYTQVEVSRTDSYLLGVKPPVRNSGELEGASSITIIGPKGTIVRDACIIANRHIHVDSKIRKEYGLVGVTKVNIKADTIKGGILNDVYLKDSEKAYFEVHLDTDDANCLFLNNNDEVEIIL